MNNAVVWNRDAIHDLLDRSDAAVSRAILAIYARQTRDEKCVGVTKEHNEIGFTAYDAPFLSSVAQRMPMYNNRLSIGQLAKARPMMKKYWRQLLDIAAENGHLVEKKIKVKKMTVTKNADETIEVREVENVAEDPAKKWGMF